MLPFWPDAIISVHKGGGNQISVNGLKKGDQRHTFPCIGNHIRAVPPPGLTGFGQ
ncbi:TPA: hypothetical protein ACX6RM_004032 [Photobacterium damselae]